MSTGKPMTSDIMHEIHIKLGDDGPVVEFHNVTLVEMMGSIEMLRREVDRALIQVEIENMQKAQNGIVPIHGSLKGRQT